MTHAEIMRDRTIAEVSFADEDRTAVDELWSQLHEGRARPC